VTRKRRKRDKLFSLLRVAREDNLALANVLNLPHHDGQPKSINIIYLEVSKGLGQGLAVRLGILDFGIQKLGKRLAGLFDKSEHNHQDANENP
jgi:hypothetical protein